MSTRSQNTIDYRYADEPLWEETVGEAVRVIIARNVPRVLDALCVPQQGATSCENLSDGDDGDNDPSPAVDTEHDSVADSSVPLQSLSRSKLVTTLTVSTFVPPLPVGAQQSAGGPRRPASAPRAPGRAELPQGPAPQRPACLSAAAPGESSLNQSS